MQPSGANPADPVWTVPRPDLPTSAVRKVEANKIAAGDIKATANVIWTHEAATEFFRFLFIG
jgi:hypothetical protein